MAASEPPGSAEPSSEEPVFGPGGIERRRPTSPYPPADFRRRAVARGIDFVIGLSPLILAHQGQRVAGALLAMTLLLVSDALFGPGRSLGKRVAGLRTMALRTRKPAGLRESIRRNALFAAALLPILLDFPGHLGVSVVAMIIVVVIEFGVALQPLTRDLGQRRIGDLLAGTQVVDTRIALRLPETIAEAAQAATTPLATPRAARDLGAAHFERVTDAAPRTGEACASP